MSRLNAVAIILAALLLVSLSGCDSKAEHRAHVDAVARMDSAAALMEENPDSALCLLQAVDSAGLTDEPTQARFSLLMAQAIEKTSDITDTVCLKAAMDYYPDYGTPTEKMILYYHIGLVHKSHGDNLKALELFHQAEMHGKNSTDTLSLARTYIAEGTIYYRLKKWDDYLLVNQRGAALFQQIGDSARYYNALLRIATAYSRSENWDSQMIYLRKVKKEYPAMSEEMWKLYYYPELFLHYQHTGDKDSLQAALDEYQINVKHMNSHDSLDFVAAYAVMGRTSDARRFLPAETGDSNILYQRRWVGMVAYLLEVEGDLKNSAIYRDRYEAMEDSVRTANISQGVEILHEKQTIENESQKKDAVIWWIVIGSIAFSIFIILPLLIVFCRRSIIDRKVRKNKERVLEEALMRLDTLNASLTEEKRRIEEFKVRQHEEREHLNTYIEQFNRILLACHIKEGYYQEIATETVNKIIATQESFLQHAEQLYAAKYPNNAEMLKSYGLTELELAICYLVALGMQSKHIAKLLGIGNIYNKTKDIRKKLGVTNSRTNLKTWLSQELTGLSDSE